MTLPMSSVAPSVEEKKEVTRVEYRLKGGSGISSDRIPAVTDEVKRNPTLTYPENATSCSANATSCPERRDRNARQNRRVTVILVRY